MENRRGPRVVIDPKVRQVGFVTPGSEPIQTTSAPVTGDNGTGNSPALVMIPLRVELPSKHMDMSAASDLISPVPSDDTDGAPKKLKERTSKAERRAIQEAQRAAKAAAKQSSAESKKQPQQHSTDNKKIMKESKPSVTKESTTEKKPSLVSATATATTTAPSSSNAAISVAEKEKRKDVLPAPRMQFDDEHRVAKAKRRAIVEQTETKNRVELFRHLPQFLHAAQLSSLGMKFFQDDLQIHRAVYQVGMQYLTWDIVGANARCVAMLMAFKEMISDYCTPPEKTFVRDITTKINSHVSFLTNCRPLAISMGNAIRYLKQRIANLPVTLTEAEAKRTLTSAIDAFIQEKIEVADSEIVKLAVDKIRDQDDVVLTHGASSVVEMILSTAHRLGKKFRVVIVDSRPRLEGKKLLRRLVQQGIRCTYTHINAISYIMQEATRVFMGAASVLSNGTVYSRVGTATVAMVAHAFRVPVMICCETYKFHERVQLDSICSNELGDPDALVNVDGREEFKDLVGWAENPHLQLLNLLYDATPADYVSMIITECGMVPPTSVPAILREYRKEPIP